MSLFRRRSSGETGQRVAGRPPPLDPGEAVKWTVLANHTVGSRAVGGRLHVTDRRLSFMPTAVEMRMGGRPWSLALTDVRSVGREPKSRTNLTGGSLRDRLRIETETGPELFVVNRLDDVIARLEAEPIGPP